MIDLERQPLLAKSSLPDCRTTSSVSSVHGQQEVWLTEGLQLSPMDLDSIDHHRGTLTDYHDRSIVKLPSLTFPPGSEEAAMARAIPLPPSATTNRVERLFRYFQIDTSACPATMLGGTVHDEEHRPIDVTYLVNQEDKNPVIAVRPSPYLSFLQQITILKLFLRHCQRMDEPPGDPIKFARPANLDTKALYTELRRRGWNKVFFMNAWRHPAARPAVELGICPHDKNVLRLSFMRDATKEDAFTYSDEIQEILAKLSRP